MGFWNKKYKHKIELLCEKYEISEVLKRYFMALPKSKQPESFENRKQVIAMVCSGDMLNNTVKCLEKIMEI